MHADVSTRSLFLMLVRKGAAIAINETAPAGADESVDWEEMRTLAFEHGLAAVVLDGIEAIPASLSQVKSSFPQLLRLQWIGEVLRQESVLARQEDVSAKMASFFHDNAIKTYVLKGAVVAECYPRPNHRISVDVDCYLASDGTSPDAWQRGNMLVETKGYAVTKDFYKNSTFHIPDVTVENHKYLIPFRGNKRLKALERLLQSLLAQDRGEDRIGETFLLRPPVMVSALFLIEHAYSHFLHEGLTWRLVLDWQMFRARHEAEICWKDFEEYMDEFGFRKFYDSFARLGNFLLGTLCDGQLTELDRMMMRDVWEPQDLHKTVRGMRGKIALAGNTWRARWKYRYFADVSWLSALWIQIRGFLFEKNPVL